MAYKMIVAEIALVVKLAGVVAVFVVFDVIYDKRNERPASQDEDKKEKSFDEMFIEHIGTRSSPHRASGCELQQNKCECSRWP